MKPKKTITILLFALLTSTVVPAFASEPTPVGPTEKATTERAMNRIDEIRHMDRSQLTTSEKKELKKELKLLKKESKPKKNGLYLSLGALIVIGILLILLL
ncbi:MAG: hypothetical protein ABI683_11400 [Ginsengibacter sp.]